MYMWIYQHGLRSLTTIICAFLKVKVTETDCPARDINYPQGRGKDKASVGWDALLSCLGPRRFEQKSEGSG